MDQKKISRIIFRPNFFETGSLFGLGQFVQIYKNAILLALCEGNPPVDSLKMFVVQKKIVQATGLDA